MRITAYMRFSIPWEKLTPSQRELCKRLDELKVAIEAPPIRKSWLSTLMTASQDDKQRGLYIYGGVGQGKTVLMDEFYEKVRSQKMRMHFHEFIIRVQKELHLQKSTSQGDLMELVARRVVGDVRLLCLDEFFVNHISDAMILKPLFENLFKIGVIVVTTSNRPPEDLYLNGLNRDRFLPFIPLLRKHCDVFNLQARDFRQEQNFSDTEIPTDIVYIIERDNHEDKILSEFRRRCPDSIEENLVLKVSDLRSITVPLYRGQEAYFRFSNLCGSQNSDSERQGKVEVSLGTEAFMVLAKRFHTIWISEVPQFDASNENDGRLRSFILLIDVLYERNVKLYIGSKIPMLRLFGMVGVVKAADEFQQKISMRYPCFMEFRSAISEPVSKDAFEKLVSNLGMTERASKLLFEAMLPPDETTLSAQRIWDICANHKHLLQGLPPSTRCLYRFDTRDDSILENEFVCSRALSRLFHMSSYSYQQQHRERFLK